MNRLLLYIMFFVAGACLSCEPTVTDREGLLSWISKKENGFVRSKVVGEVQYSCRILPATCLAWRDIELDDSLDMDDMTAISRGYDSSLVMLFHIAPEDPQADWDVMTANVEDHDGYREKVLKMSFDMKENFVLTIDGDARHPVLVRLENHYGMKQGRNLMLVFDLEGSTQEELFHKDFTLDYTDDLFHSGKMRFNFHDLKSLPKIKTTAGR